MSIDVTVEGHVAIVVMNRPDRLNALDGDHYRALSEAWVRVRDDRQIRAAMITGAGTRAFTVGADLKSGVTEPSTAQEFWLTQKNQLLNRGLEVWKPIVAAVNGHCLGGGMTLLLATDIRIAGQEAVFGTPEVKRGLIPGNGGTQRILDQLPYPIAMEMLLTGEPVDAEAAHRWGLVNEVVAPNDVDERALAVATTLSMQAPLAVQAAKELAVRSREMGRPEGLRYEQAIVRLLQQTADAAEGVRAFAERRQSEFKGE